MATRSGIPQAREVRSAPTPTVVSSGESVACGLADRRERVTYLRLGDLLLRLGFFAGGLSRQIGQRDHSDQRALFVDHGKPPYVRVPHDLFGRSQRVSGSAYPDLLGHRI